MNLELDDHKSADLVDVLRIGGQERRHVDSDPIDRVVTQIRRRTLELDRGYSAHSMGATVITTALENGA